MKSIEIIEKQLDLLHLLIHHLNEFESLYDNQNVPVSLSWDYVEKDFISLYQKVSAMLQQRYYTLEKFKGDET